MLKKILLSLAAAVIVFAGWKYFYGGDESPVSGTQEAREEFADPEGLAHKVLSFSIDGRNPDGAKQWHLEGNSAEIIDGDVHLRDLKAVAYSDRATINLTSERGIYKKKKGEVELIGNVHVTTDRDVELTTQRARWSQHTKEISSDAIVHIQGQGMQAVGKGAMANSDEQIAMLLEDVMVQMEPRTKVNSDGKLMVDFKANRAVFEDNVRVEDKDGKLLADKLTVDIDPDNEKIEQVTAEGNVRLKRGRSYTVSQKAVYTESTKHAKLIGKPRVVIDPGEIDELQGLNR
jgi:LPS export ABC transporter protein LptC